MTVTMTANKAGATTPATVPTRDVYTPRQTEREIYDHTHLNPTFTYLVWHIAASLRDVWDARRANNRPAPGKVRVKITYVD